MVGYRCYILDAEDHILQAHELDCDDDRQAEAAAAVLLAQDPYHRAVEVWAATRRVTKFERDATTGLRLARRPQHSTRVIGSVV
jgi:hypothetical protein